MRECFDLWYLSGVPCKVSVFSTKFWLQLLERALEAAGNDLDSAIKSLTDLHLEQEETNLSSIAGTCEDGTPVNHLATEGICTFPFLVLFLYYTVT